MCTACAVGQSIHGPRPLLVQAAAGGCCCALHGVCDYNHQQRVSQLPWNHNRVACIGVFYHQPVMIGRVFCLCLPPCCAQVRRVMIRRLKKDVLTQLPPKRRQVGMLPMTGDGSGLAGQGLVCTVYVCHSSICNHPLLSCTLVSLGT